MKRAKAILLAALLTINAALVAFPSLATVLVDSSKTGWGQFSSLVVQSGGNLDIYNTADQTTSYERLRADWSGNVGRILTQAGGTGVVRGMSLASGTYAGTSGTTTALTVNPTINQSGTAGYTALDVNPTETATGSGTKLLQRWANGGSRQASINNSGRFDAINVVSLNALGFASAFDATIDISLNRDAADTLALRRGPNAQTFRVYNTYTDASNYERTGLYWSSNVAYLQNQNAGTGSARLLVPVTGTTTVSGLPTCNSALAGGRSMVTDANATTFASTVAAGGANIMPVVCNGTNWIIGEAANDPAYQLTAQG